MNDPIEHDEARRAADVERRSFLGQVATLGAAAVFAGPRAANAAQAKKKTHKERRLCFMALTFANDLSLRSQGTR